MSLKVGLIATSELYEESLRRRVTGISQSAKLLMRLFDQLEQYVVVGATPREIIVCVQQFAADLAVDIDHRQIAFCRFGQVHPDATLYMDEPLVAGEAFTLDMWINYQGYHADLARIYTLPPYQYDLLRLKRGALAVQEAAVKAAKAGERILSIVQAAQQAAVTSGVHIVEGACGHGVGQALHEEPMIPFCYNAGSPFSRLKAGTIITIEPLVTLKPASLTIKDDGVVTLPLDAAFCYAEAMVYIGEDQSIVIGR